MTVSLTRLERLLAEATERPWHVSANDWIYMGRWFGLIARVENDLHEDAVLIAEAVNALPALIAAVKALNRLLDAIGDTPVAEWDEYVDARVEALAAFAFEAEA